MMHSTAFASRAAPTAAGRRALCCAILAGLSVLIAACGLQNTGQGASGAGTGFGGGSGTGSRGHHGKGARAAVKACGPAAIRIRLDARSVGVAAGSELLPLDFTNVSATRCRLGGFPGVALTSRAGRQVGAAATLDRGLAARSLVLGAGRTAHIWLRLLDVMNLPASRCHPVNAAGLRVTLPGQSASTFVRHAVMTCSMHMHSTDILMTEPFRAGQAQPGTAQ